jgi:hypothetical protein
VSQALSSREVAQRQLAAVKTGIYVKAENSLKLRHRSVRRLVGKLYVALPWLTPADEPAARAWSELEILRQRVFSDLMTRGLTTSDGEARSLLREHRQMATTQLAYGRELGMTPAARASMGLAASSSAQRVEEAQARLRSKSVEAVTA